MNAPRRDPLTVRLDQDRCVGSGQCVLAAPEVFDQREDDGIAYLLDPAPPAGSRPDVEQAAAVCPALAITVEEDTTVADG